MVHADGRVQCVDSAACHAVCVYTGNVPVHPAGILWSRTTATLAFAACTDCVPHLVLPAAQPARQILQHTPTKGTDCV